jgi:hypothetical protein
MGWTHLGCPSIMSINFVLVRANKYPYGLVGHTDRCTGMPLHLHVRLFGWVHMLYMLYQIIGAQANRCLSKCTWVGLPVVR